MPIRSSDWTAKAYLSPETLRAEGDKWDQIAAEADRDGDAEDAARCRKEAANFRQMAREKAMDERAAKEGGNP